MTFSRGNTARSIKWLIAVVLFVLTLTVTFSDVYGDPVYRPNDRNKNENLSDGSDSRPPADNPGGTIEESQANPPEAVPEPGTIILLASGLSAMYMMRRRMRK
jgi:hypothetical protein